MNKKYIFQIITEEVKEITVNADNYEQAEKKFEDGDVDSIEEVESSLIFSECIKMPENIDEETKWADVNYAKKKLMKDQHKIK